MQMRWAGNANEQKARPGLRYANEGAGSCKGVSRSRDKMAAAARRAQLVLGHLAGAAPGPGAVPRAVPCSGGPPRAASPDDVVVVHGRRTAIGRARRGGFKVRPGGSCPPGPAGAWHPCWEWGAPFFASPHAPLGAGALLDPRHRCCALEESESQRCMMVLMLGVAASVASPEGAGRCVPGSPGSPGSGHSPLSPALPHERPRCPSPARLGTDLPRFWNLLLPG